MTWLMSVAAGTALGYFLVQFIANNRNGGFCIGKGRLHKSATNKQIAGVCGGLAEYLDADPTIVRLVTLLLVFGWGSGLLAYIICAIVMPEGQAEDEIDAEEAAEAAK